METPFVLGQHAAQLSALGERSSRIEATVSGIDTKLDTVILALAERRGERKTIATLAVLAGGVGSVLVSLLLKVL